MGLGGIRGRPLRVAAGAAAEGEILKDPRDF